MKKNIITLIICLLPLWIFSQIPYGGYYDDAVGKQREELREALYEIINDNITLEYTALWNYFILTDSKPNGKVWDIYSDIPDSTPAYEYTFITNQCGNYSGEGDCFNREHSIPNSWFGGEKFPMHSDLFHLYPTDGWVNNKRSSFPFGEVSNANWTSTNGSKLGACSYPGYTGTVFEPIDEYKGDLARTYFYMSVRYKNINLGQTSLSVFSGADLDPWALSLFMEWHLADTVSAKEIARNEKIYTIQNNRNPFIDYPELASYLWGNDTTNIFAPYIVSDITDYQPRITEIFPNPAHEKITLLFADVIDGKIHITDMVGRVVMTCSIERATEFSINISGLPSGVYTLFLEEKERKEIKKFVIW